MALMEHAFQNASAKRSEENKDDAKSKAAKSEVKCDKVVSECEGKKSESVLPTTASAAVSQTRKSVKVRYLIMLHLFYHVQAAFRSREQQHFWWSRSRVFR